jgi:hypothetical protein
MLLSLTLLVLDYAGLISLSCAMSAYFAHPKHENTLGSLSFAEVSFQRQPYLSPRMRASKYPGRQVV